MNWMPGSLRHTMLLTPVCEAWYSTCSCHGHVSYFLSHICKQIFLFFCSCYCRKSLLRGLRELGTKILQPYGLQVKDQIFKAKIIIQLLAFTKYWIFLLLSTRFGEVKVIRCCVFITGSQNCVEDLKTDRNDKSPVLSLNRIQSF